LNININEEKESFRAPVDLIECEEINCDKTFTSERALKYQARHQTWNSVYNFREPKSRIIPLPQNII